MSKKFNIHSTRDVQEYIICVTAPTADLVTDGLTVAGKSVEMTVSIMNTRGSMLTCGMMHVRLELSNWVQRLMQMSSG